MVKLQVLSCILVLSLAMAEEVRISPCPEVSTSTCSVTNVHINPCPEALEGKACRVKKGRSVSITYDIKPEFQVDTLFSQAYWAKGSMDLPLLGMETDGCKSTNCPIAPGTTQSYQWDLDVDKKFPTRPFTVKMKMENQKQDFCCFLFNIKLVK